MDKIEKVLARLSAKERATVTSILKKLSCGDTSTLDTKKLKGRDDVFRVRKGDIRIVYRLENGVAYLLKIERRNDKTYKF